MKYCINCGKPLEAGVKFCPFCGAKVQEDSDEFKNPPLKKQKMEKGVVKSLKDKAIRPPEPKPKNPIESREGGMIANHEAQAGPEKTEEGPEEIASMQSLPSTTIGIYFVLNFILMMGSPGSDEIMGIFIYTLIVLVVIFIRRNKEKPFNWLLNIFVSLQAILVFATGMMTMEYLDAGGDSVGAMIQLGLLVLLLIAIISLLYKGNRRSL